MDKWCIERITDISNDLCRALDDRDITTKDDLQTLYTYHSNNHHIYPNTNWHAHRIRVLSCIAVKLQDKVKIWQCHFWILEYFYEKSHCHCHCVDLEHYGVNHDFFHRDSLNYLVYGSQALLNAALYLKPYTHYPYKDLFEPIVLMLKPYLDGSKTHREYVHSEIHSDKQKPEYGQLWQPSYANTFLRLYQQLETEKNSLK